MKKKSGVQGAGEIQQSGVIRRKTKKMEERPKATRRSKTSKLGGSGAGRELDRGILEGQGDC